MARLDLESSNALFDVLADWEQQLKHFEKDKRVPMDVKVGDKVLYGKYSGTEVTIDNESLLILREADVLAVIG